VERKGGDVQAYVQTTSQVVLAILALGAAMAWLRPVMIPFVLAVFIAIILAPLIDLQERYLRLPRMVALLTTVIVTGVLLLVLGSLVSASVQQLSANADLYSQRLSVLTERSIALLPDDLEQRLRETRFDEIVQSPVQTVGGVLMGTTNAILDLLSKSLMVFLFVTFLLIGAPSGNAEGVLLQARTSIQRYLITKALISAATGLLVGVTLSLLGIDLALVFGLLAFLLNFIPSIGSIIATLLPLPIVIVSPHISPTVAVLAIMVPGSIQLFIGNFLEPRIMGEALDLHPVTVLLGLMVWGMLWGIVGMLLATPIMAVIRLVLERFDGSRPVADLMAGRLGRVIPEPASA
jgi:AI-2 transport protein TqsA